MYLLLCVYCVVFCIDFFVVVFFVVEESVIGVVKFSVVCSVIGFVCGVVNM